MKKTLLKERFQQLAGIKPLYTINESILDKLMDIGSKSIESIKSTVKSIIFPNIKSKENELEKVINNPEISNDLDKLEDLKRNLESFIQNYDLEGESSSLKEAKGAAAGFMEQITRGLMSLSAGMWSATGLFGFGKEETLDYWDKATNMLGKGLDYFSWTKGTIDQTEPTVEYLYGSPTQYAIATALLLAVNVLISKIRDKQIS